MSDLRERLAVALAGDEAPTVKELTDRALVVFADELHDLADWIDRGVTFPIPPSVISALVRERADSIDPKATP